MAHLGTISEGFHGLDEQVLGTLRGMTDVVFISLEQMSEDRMIFDLNAGWQCGLEVVETRNLKNARLEKTCFMKEWNSTYPLASLSFDDCNSLTS